MDARAVRAGRFLLYELHRVPRAWVADKFEESRVYIANARSVSKFWAKASAPPLSFSRAEAITWMKYYFPAEGAAVVRAISHGFPGSDEVDYAYCFKVTPERYRNAKVGAGSGKHGMPLLTGSLLPFADLKVTSERAPELRRVIAEYASRHKPVEEHYLERWLRK